jgi:hypothetical protein
MIVTLFSALLTVAPQQPTNVAGSWSWIAPNRDESDVAEATLSLKLRVRDSRIYGSSCLISSFGNRIDCPMPDDDCNVWGIDSGNSTEVTIRYDYLGTDHDAKLRIDDGHLNLSSETYAEPWSNNIHGGISLHHVADLVDIQEPCKDVEHS